MIAINAEQILEIMSSYILPFARLSGFLMTLSVISSRNIPARFRMLLALAVTVIIVPVIPAYTGVDLFSFQAFILVAEQSLIGIALGFVSRLMLETFVIGSQIIAMQSGLGFASLIDPANGNSVPALGQLFLMLTTLLFLSMNGHLIMIRLVVESFSSFPIGSSQSLAGMFWQLVNWTKWIFAAALVMAIVSIASLLIVNIAFGVMTRAAPQINVFAVGFPMTMLAGLILVWMSLSFFLPHFERQLSRSTLLICEMVQIEC
ncbi:MAG: flagellar biosynthetic protein FliR [Enterobacterales bacterium]|nr:flagellar biosynthetic protein FliR [Enterobacterales bacterium]